MMVTKDRNVVVIIIISLLLMHIQVNSLEAQQRHRMGDCQPVYGGYTKGVIDQPYGARRNIKTEQEARLLLEKFFLSNGNSEMRDLKIGRIKEMPNFFEAEILNSQNIPVDLVIIDKRTGRIRSVY
jgi:hypothetical protein